MSSKGRKKSKSYEWTTELFSSDEEEEDNPSKKSPPACFLSKEDGPFEEVTASQFQAYSPSRDVAADVARATISDLMNGCDDEEAQTEEELGKSLCQLNYEQSNNCKAHLIAMCWGIKNSDERDLGDLDAEPYKSCSNKKKIHPNNLVIHKEILRRSKVLKIKEPKCSNWNRAKSCNWLMKHPITNAEDVAFLLSTEEDLFNVLNRASREKATGGKTSTAWTSIDPWLHLIMCAASDEAKHALLMRDQVMTAQELTLRNDANRAPTYEEVVARLFNDESRIYLTACLPNLHHSFAQQIELPFEKMPGPVTPEEVKNRLADCRAKLVKVINKWELSGNGFGQRGFREDGECEEGFGHLDDRHYHAGDNRSNFLGTYKEYLLYMWETFDVAQILDIALSVLSKEIAFETEDTSSSLTDCMGNESTKKRRRKAEQAEEEQRQFREKFGSAMAVMSYAAVAENLRATEMIIADYQVRALSANEQEKAVLDEFIKKQRATAATLEERLAAVVEGNGSD